jgi:hypothetical protein
MVIVLFYTQSAFALEKLQQGEVILRDAYHRNMDKLKDNSFGLPLYLESSVQDDRVKVNVYGIFNHPFGSVANALKMPENWCDIVSIHPNVKACTFQEVTDAWLLTFYLGRKNYQPPEDTHQVIYRYRDVVQSHSYMEITLSSETGPYGTKDHRMRFEAILLDAQRTFVHVSYSYNDSAPLRILENIYFSTLGRDKVGFTVTGMDINGSPVYIGGPRGAVERSATRYYLAIQAFMNTQHNPEDRRFDSKISEWFDLTTRYKKQLYDLEKQEYLTFKAKEHINQVTLQRLIGHPQP